MVGEKIKKLRKKRGMSLKKLSKKIDISVSFLSDIENEKSQPSLNRLIDIADGLDTTIAYLLGEVSIDPELLELCEKNDMKDILKKFKNIDRWSKKDIEELKTYLDIKNRIINEKEQT